MNEILLITLALLIIFFLYNVWQLLFIGKDQVMGLDKWKISLFILALSSLVFFLYITSALSSLGEKQTLTDAYGETWVQTSNTYAEAFAYLPLIIGMYLAQWMFTLMQIILGFRMFGGRDRMQRLGE